MCVAVTKKGAVRGVRAGDLKIWRGIPYALPPINELRFRPAQESEAWDGVLDATNFGHVCHQDYPSGSVSEDCLTLNIWKPEGEQLPVLFFIHGGSFCQGAGSDGEFEGSVLAREAGVVVVTINYRLGVLGFMDFSYIDERFSPNCGFTDIIAALKWTHENIAAFGGDPQNITVCGQSAGAYCSCALALNERARPYISKAIMMSGAPTLLQSPGTAQKIAQRFVELAEIESAERLINMPAEKLAAMQRGFAHRSGMGAATFSLEVDGKIIMDHPIPLARRGAGRDIPMLIGTTREEMSFLLVKQLSNVLEIGDIFKEGESAEEEAVARRISRAYEKYGKRGRKMLMSDLVFRMASLWFGEVYSRYAPTWMYRFDYETAAARVSGLHAFHSTDIPFLFGTYSKGITRPIFWLSPLRSGINRISRELRADFATFMRTGKLPWEPCRNEHTPGKCYGQSCKIEQVVEPEVKRAYEGSAFKRRSLEGEENI